MALTAPKVVILKQEHIDFLTEYFGFKNPEKTFEKYKSAGNAFISIIRDTNISEDGSRTTIIAGVCLFELNKPLLGDGLISYIAVNPKYRGNQLSSQLISSAESYMSAHNLITSVTNIRHDNQASIISFKRSGYVIKNVEDEYNNGDGKIKLVKHL